MYKKSKTSHKSIFWFGTITILALVIGAGLSGADLESNILVVLVLYATLVAVIFYAEETRAMANEMTTQTQLQQKPILVPFVRVPENGKISPEYYIPGLGKKEYTIKIRNVGHGAAANIKVILEKQGFRFEVNKYQQNFLESGGDEQAIRIVRLGQGNKRERLSNISELYGAMFSLGCQDFSERYTADNDKERYWFKYRLTVDDRNDNEIGRWQEIKFHYIESQERRI